MLRESVFLGIVLLAGGLAVQAQSTVPGNSLGDKLAWLETNVQSNGN
jgi:hypothetical protein